MSAIVQFQLSLEALVEVIASLDLPEKRQLQEILGQQIIEAEALNKNASETIPAKYAADEYLTLDEYTTDSVESFHNSSDI